MTGRFNGRCRRCAWVGPGRPAESLAQDDSVWHTYEDHRAEWDRIVGPRRPRNLDPRVAQ